MSRDLAINVNVNPNGVASPTETRTTETPQSTEIQGRTATNAIKGALILSVAQRGVRIATSNIGELTGNKSAQRNAQAVGNLVTLGVVALKNPVAASVLAATQVGQAAIGSAIENRNVQIQRDYNRQIRQATHNNNRR